VRWLLRFVASHTFVPFAWYRIVFGGFILLSAWAGWIRWVG
jgi:undecaprenyl-diphosphatase